MSQVIINIKVSAITDSASGRHMLWTLDHLMSDESWFHELCKRCQSAINSSRNDYEALVVVPAEIRRTGTVADGKYIISFGVDGLDSPDIRAGYPEDAIEYETDITCEAYNVASALMQGVQGYLAVGLCCTTSKIIIDTDCEMDLCDDTKLEIHQALEGD